MDKKDKEELEEWKNKSINYIDTYGIDIFAPKKNTKITSRLFKLLYRITKIVLIMFAIAIVVLTFIILSMKWKECYSQVHIDPVETLSNMYNKNVKVKHKLLDENRNGKYILTVKQNKEIHFNAIVEWTSMKNDYSDRCQKYYFDKWENENKEKIIVKESYEDNLLIYSQFIDIKDEKEIENAVKLIYEFIKFAGDFYFPDWDIYLNTAKGKIYPFNSININMQESIDNAKRMYVEIQNKKENTIEKTENDFIKEFLGMPIT